LIQFEVAGHIVGFEGVDLIGTPFIIVSFLDEACGVDIGDERAPDEETLMVDVDRT
jgi:hypothetical protein